MEDPYFFCKLASKKVSENISLKREAENKFNIWIVTDLRLQVELNYFKTYYPSLLKTVRIISDENVRKSRDWIYTKGLYSL